MSQSSFSSFALSWLEMRAKVAIKPSTLASYRSIISAHLMPYFRGLLLTAITPEMIQSYLLTRLKKAQAKTVLNELLCLRAILKWAVKWGRIPSNPADQVDRPRVQMKEMRTINPREISSLLTESEAPYQTLFLTAVLTGMRRGELLALRWEDIDWTTKQIHVRRSLWHRQIVSPKTKYSKRRIDMSPGLTLELQKHKLRSSPSEWIFCNARGKTLDGDNMVKRHFIPALVQVSLKNIRFHDLRHTNVALRIQQNQNVKYIQNQLGHASIQTTLDRYGHLLEESNPAEAAKLDGALGWLRGQDLNLGPLGYEPNGLIIPFPPKKPAEPPSRRSATPGLLRSAKG